MKRKIFIKQSMVLCLSMLCMAIIMMLTSIDTKASDDAKSIIYEPNYTYSSETYIDSTTGEKIAPKLEGYLFAGWYTLNNTTYKAVRTPVDDEIYYAKFVPEEVLSIKAQVSGTLCDEVTTNDSTSAIRFLTSVDSTSYEKIGFKIKKGKNGTEADANTSDYVYRTVYAVDATADNPGEALKDYNPENVFHSSSYYFKAWTIKNIKENVYNTDITVTPYWITLDGTRVEGTKSIKTVNLGRSWVHVNASSNTSDNLEFGTRNHPFTSFADALDAVLLTNNGKVIIQGNDNAIKTAGDFTWKKAERTRNITIIGDNQTTSQLDFSAVSTLNINDSVKFENMTLTLPTTTYANGHLFKITENVTAENASAVIYGGGKGTTVAQTNIEIYAGTYKEVWGGGNGGIVSGNCNVTIENAEIYYEKGDVCRVFGSGNGDTVNGNVYVTIGGTFNEAKDVAEFERTDSETGHSRYSSVHGAGTGTVKGDTYVSIKDQAEVDYVYGGGASNSEVQGTCHVEILGGTIFSIYGGGKGDNSTSAGKNVDTSVVVKDGKVCQIIGGNGNSMEGNSYVEIAGGDITRRIHGGCYNATNVLSFKSDHYVTGYSIVAIKDVNAISSLLANNSLSDDAGISAGSRHSNNHSEEKAVLICNDGIFDVIESKLNYQKYDYLVQANAGGTVSAVGERLKVVPIEGNDAIVRLNSNTGIASAYMSNTGLCRLQELTDKATKVYVVFGSGQLADEDLSGYEAKVDGTYLDTFANAFVEAKELSQAKEEPVVTLLKDVSVDSKLQVDSGENITVQSEGENQYKITATSDEQNVFTVYGTLTIDNLAMVGGKRSIEVFADGELYSTGGVLVSGAKDQGINVSNGTMNMSGVTISVLGTGNQALVLQNSKTKAEISNFSVNGDGGSAAVRIMNGASVVLNDGTVNANKTYGIYMDGSSDATIEDVNVIRGEQNKTTAVVVAGTSQFTMKGESRVDGNNFYGRGVEVQGTFILEGGSIMNHKMSSASENGAVISANKQDGNGVYVVAGGKFIMNGGTIEDNATTNAGAAVAVNGTTAVFTMNDGIIEGNTAKYGGAVMVRSGEFTMKGGTITDNNGTTSGGAICVSAGTFNMEKGIVSLNTSPKGGALFMNNASGTINLNANGTGAITNNTSTSFGGGIYINKGNFNMDGCIVEKNTATTLGGGVYLDGGSVSICGGTICDNTAENGGGVYATSAAAATMNGGIISNNTATLGGGVYVPESATFTMCGGTISGNEATGQGGGGVYVLANGTFNMNAPVEGNNAGIIKENKAASGKYGAGVLVYGTFEMNAGTISNHGSEDNPLNVEGAGVCIYDNAAEFVMNGGEIRDNFSSKAGAGVSVRANAPIFTMNGGKITSNNSTTNAGGIVIRNNAVFTISNSAEISNNTASSTTGMGGGVYKEGSATLVLNGGLFAENSAAYGADIYYTGTISLSAPLTSDVIINQGKTYKEGNIIATRAQAGDGSYLISEEDFVASMKHIKVQPNSEGEWFVNDSGNLAKAYAEVLSTGKCYASFQEALEIANTADKADTITILRDVTLTEAVTVENSLKLTSNSAVTITADATLEENMFTVAVGTTLEIVGASADVPFTIIGGSAKVISNSGTTKVSNVNINGSETAIYNNGGTVGTNDNPITNVTISNTTGYSFHIHNGAVNAENLVIQGAANRGIHVDGATQTVNIDGLQVVDAGAIGIAITEDVQNGTNITLKNAVIDNANITDKTQIQGIVAKGGMLNLDNVKIHNFVGTGNNCHGLLIQGANVRVTADEQIENGTNYGLSLSKVYGHGVYVLSGTLHTDKMKIDGTIDGTKTTRCAVYITSTDTFEYGTHGNVVAVVKGVEISNCAAMIRPAVGIKIVINNTAVTETKANQSLNPSKYQ